MSDAANFTAREKSVGSHLPYAAHIDDRTLLTRDGLLVQILHIQGFPFETADSDELNYRKALREQMLQAVGNSRFALHHIITRRRIHAELGGTYPDDFSSRLASSWNSRLQDRQLFVNDLFLAVIRRPVQGRVGWVPNLLRQLTRRQSEQGRAEQAAELKALDAASDQLVSALGHYDVRPLSVYDGASGPCSEILELLSYLLNGEMRPVLLPEGAIADYLPYRRISFGQNLVEHAPTGETDRLFTAMLSLKDYPSATLPGMLDDLLRLPHEMVLSQSFGFVDRQAGLSRMNLALRRMQASDDEALSLRSELSIAKDELAAGRAAFGEHHFTIAVRSQDMETVRGSVAEVQSALTDLGMISVREDVALEPAYWAQFPGNFKYIARRAMISSANFASLASFHNFPAGKPANNHWGEAVTILETTSAGPYHFNFHQGDLGNFTVIGPSGSGKTVVLNFLLAQARKFEPRITFFDKDRGAELFVRAIGGEYHILRPGIASGLNPLLLPDTAENRRFLVEWLVQLASHNGQSVTPQEQERLRDAIDASYAAAPQYRRLSYFVQLLRGKDRPHANDLWARLQPWWGEGEHSWLFDNAKDHSDIDTATIGFDMTRILDEPRLRTPAMMYLFHRVEERLDGTPAIIVVDEGWKALDDSAFVHKIKDWEKTIRKKNGIVGFATQSAEDALSSSIASAIIEQAATQIFMANPKARREDYCDGFGLTAHEYDLVRGLPDSAHCFLIKHGRDSVVARLDLSGEHEILTILSGRESTVRLLDEIRERVGDDPAHWLPELLDVA